MFNARKEDTNWRTCNETQHIGTCTHTPTRTHTHTHTRGRNKRVRALVRPPSVAQTRPLGAAVRCQVKVKHKVAVLQLHRLSCFLRQSPTQGKKSPSQRGFLSRNSRWVCCKRALGRVLWKVILLCNCLRLMKASTTINHAASQT